MSDLVLDAFRALGPAPSRREIALVARAIRESGDEAALAVFNVPTELPRDDCEAVFDDAAFGRVAAIAERVGAGHFVALDLYTATVYPDWRLPGRGAALGPTELLCSATPGRNRCVPSRCLAEAFRRTRHKGGGGTPDAGVEGVIRLPSLP